MKKACWLFVLLALGATNGYTQIRRPSPKQAICFTKQDYTDILKDIPGSQRPLPVASPFVTIRIYAHVVRTSTGERGLTSTQLDDALTLLTADYAPHGICFFRVGTDSIDNSAYIDNGNVFAQGTPVYTALINTNKHSDAIDIYFLPADNIFPAGLANGIPGDALIIGGSYFNTNTSITSLLPVSHVLSHEMGHCLGLFHTFHNAGSGSCNELVDGSNAATCGDFVTDTPADPGPLFDVYTDSSCNLRNMTMTDANSQLYAPDTRNVMAYVPPDCMSYFTDGQSIRFHNAIAISAVLQPRIVPPTVYAQNLNYMPGAGTR